MKRWLVPILLCLVIVAAGLQLVWMQLTDYGRVLRINWGIALPKGAGCRQVYSAETEQSFLGDGLRYHVFSCRDGEAADGMLSWLPAPVRTKYSGSAADAVQCWLDALDVPAEQRPDLSGCRIWYDSQPDHSEILVLWDETAARLYVAESFL